MHLHIRLFPSSDTPFLGYYNRFTSVTGMDSPFSAVAIFKNFNLAKMVVGNTTGDPMFKDKSPAQLLVQATNVSNREHKQRCLVKLEEILKRFADYGLRSSAA